MRALDFQDMIFYFTLLGEEARECEKDHYIGSPFLHKEEIQDNIQ